MISDPTGKELKKLGTIPEFGGEARVCEAWEGPRDGKVKIRKEERLPNHHQKQLDTG